jgi:magnesium transporter
MHNEKFALQEYKTLLLKQPKSSNVLSKIPIEHLVTTLLKLPHEVFKDLLHTISYEKLAEAISYVESNKAKHMIHRIDTIDTQLQKQIYTLLQEEQKHKIKQLLQYSDDEVGAYMHLELLCATIHEDIAAVKEKITHSKKKQQHAPFIQLFVCDKRDRLIATFDIANLLPYPKETKIKDLLKKESPDTPLSINEHSSISKAVEVFELYNLSSLAVVDKRGKLLGRLLFDDIYTFIRVQEERQALTMLGTHHEAEKSFFTAQRKRLEWLFINLCAILLSALVVNYFKGTIQEIISLAVLMPIVAALGGDVGNQAVTITVRRLSLGDINAKRARKLILKELTIGIINGLLIGLFVGTLAYIWFDQYMLGIVVGLAIIINLSIAGLIGSFLPIFFKRFNIDPAIASPLLLTTATDAMGFFIFLGLAKIMLL